MNDDIKKYLEQRDRIKKAMNKLTEETAEELGYDHVKITNGGDLTSRTIGMHTGKVGGTVVKKLVEKGEEQLIKQYGNKNS